MLITVQQPRLHALPREASAAAPATPCQLGAGVGLLLLFAAASFDREVAGPALAILIGLPIFVVCLLRLVATLASPRDVPDLPLPDAMLPSYTLLVPLYREAEVVPQLVAALRRLDYPPALLQVLLLVELEDGATRLALARADLPQGFEILVMPPGAPRTKPRALSAGLPLAHGTLLSVYDAEDLPEPDQLRRAAARFAARPDLVCLQARLAIDNAKDGWLAALFAVEYAVLFDVLNPGLARLRLTILLGGTSNHFRTDLLRQVGGWDAWNVTEDADLGLRIARHGLQVGTLASTTHEEARARPRAWLRQRRRWMKGWMQTFVVHTRSPVRLWHDLGPGHCLAALALLANGHISSLLGLGLSLVLVLELEGGLVHGLWLANAGLGATAVTAPLLLALHRRRLWRLWPVLWLLPLRWALLTFAAWWALFDLWRRPFHWGTTRHGLGTRPGASVDLTDPAF